MDIRKEIKKMVIQLGGVQRTADFLECSRISVYNWINGKYYPKMDIFLELCELTDNSIIVKRNEIDYSVKRTNKQILKK